MSLNQTGCISVRNEVRVGAESVLTSVPLSTLVSHLLYFYVFFSLYKTPGRSLFPVDNWMQLKLETEVCLICTKFCC